MLPDMPELTLIMIRGGVAGTAAAARHAAWLWSKFLSTDMADVG
jgi:hypothetical protein